MTHELEQSIHDRPADQVVPPDVSHLGRTTTAPDEAAEPTLGALVTATTRRAPDTLLAACVIVGLVGTGAIALATPTWWRALPPLVLLSTFGAWGIADRERHATGPRGVTFAVVRGVAVLASLLAAGTMVLAFMGVAIGRWIS